MFVDKKDKVLEIIHNSDNLKIDDIDNVVRRAKLLIESSNNKIILCFSDKNYFLLGGHFDNDEDDFECLHREVLEEAGIDIQLDKLEAFMTIKYLNKDYPNVGVNTLSIANYYYIVDDLIPNKKSTKLTDREIAGGFTLKEIDKDVVLDVLDKSLEFATRKVVTLDTMDVIKEYLKINNI